MGPTPLDLLDLTFFGANFSPLHPWTSCLHPLQSLPLLMPLLSFGSASFSVPRYFWVFFHFTSLEVDIFLPPLLEDPVAIHRASDWKSQNTAFLYSTMDDPQYLWAFFPPRRCTNTEELNTLSSAREEIHQSSENVQVCFSTEELSMFLIELNVYNHSVHVEEPCWLTRE